MATILKLIFYSCLITHVFSKTHQLKEIVDTKSGLATFMKYFSDEEISQGNSRFARHLQAVTESVIEHLFKELKHQYSSKTYNPNSPIRRLLRDLNKEVKRNEHSKMVKDKQKKRMANKKKHKILKKKSNKGTSGTLLLTTT